MAYSELLYDVSDRIATITINRPERMNAWTDVLETELRQAIAQAVESRQVRAIILTGAGRAFCAGADMERLKKSAGGAARAPIVAPRAEDTAYKYSYLLGVPKPLIAAINGPAAGVGLCLALFCDFRFMAEGAVLTTAYARRGVAAEYGVAWILPRLIGLMNATDLLLSGRKVSAEEAASMGLVRLLPSDGFVEEIRRRIQEMTTHCSPRSISVIKRQLLAGTRQSLADACHLADIEMTLAAGSADFREGVAHFIEKRAPNFTGEV
ncbi:MAG: enoyl-CoA hydratase-related protein [Xanthobacteraceae bacterium]